MGSTRPYGDLRHLRYSVRRRPLSGPYHPAADLCRRRRRADACAFGQGRGPPRHLSLDHRHSYRRGRYRRAESSRDRNGKSGDRMGRARTGNLDQHQREVRSPRATDRRRASIAGRIVRRLGGIRNFGAQCGPAGGRVYNAGGRRAVVVFRHAVFLSRRPGRITRALRLAVRGARIEAALSSHHERSI